MNQDYIKLLIERQAIVDRHVQELREFDRRITAFRDTCPHANEKYYPDPCGGFNGYYGCPDCEKDLGKKWPVTS